MARIFWWAIEQLKWYAYYTLGVNKKGPTQGEEDEELMVKD